MGKRVVSLGPDAEGGVDYCAVRFREGELRMVFHPERLATNVYDVVANFDRAVDDGARRVSCSPSTLTRCAQRSARMCCPS